MPQPKHPAAVAGLLISFFAGLVGALLWLMPKPFTRLEYMIAGTAATALCLVMFMLILTRGAPEAFRTMFRRAGAAEPTPRTVRRSEQSS